MTKKDPNKSVRVSIPMDPRSTHLAAAFSASHASSLVAVAAGLVLALGACGGDSKTKSKTTPTGSTGSVTTIDMKDGKPQMGNNVKTTMVDSKGNPTGTTTTGGTGTGTPKTSTPSGNNNPTTTTAIPKPPQVRPPIREPTMAQVKSELRRHTIRARNALRRNDPNAAIVSAKAALAVYSNSIDAVVLLAQAYYLKKLDDTAEALLTMVLRTRAKKARAQRHAEFYYTLGLIYNRTDRKALAAKAFARVVSTLDANHKGALMNLGAYHLRNKVYADALRLFKKLVLTLRLGTPTAYTNLGTAYRGRSADAALSKSTRRDYLKKAEYYYKKALFVDRNYVNAVFNLGVLYLDADPFPLGDRNMSKLRRLKKAKAYFDDYQRLTGTKQKRVTRLQKLARRRLKKEKRRLKKLRKKRNK